MLELFYYSPVRIQALRDGPGGPALEDFAKSLVEAKYTVGSARPHIRAAEHFIYWAHQQGIAVSSLDAEALDRFNQHLSQCRCLGYSPTRRVIRQRGARMFLIRRRGAVVVRRAGAGPKTPEPPLFTAFRRWMQEQRGTHESTLDNYGRPILDLLRSIGDDPTQFGAEKLRQFILERYQRRTSGAIKVYVTALRMFVRFLIADVRCAADLDASIPSVAHWRDASLPQYLQPEEVERVISGCDPDFLVGRRDRAILLLLARLGLRASDIVQLRLNDIDWQEAQIRVSGKGRRQTQLPLTQEVGEALAAYLMDGRPATNADAVFVRSCAPFLPFNSHSTVSVIVDRALRRARVVRPRRGAAHLLRHSLATAMLRQGAPIQDIAAVLRHRSITTTQVYAKVDIESLRQIALPWPEVPSC
jgi:integrase/recombinase XerD